MYPHQRREANQVVNLVGGLQDAELSRSHAGFQNKNVTCQYRGVGHPIACSITEAGSQAAQRWYGSVEFADGNPLPMTLILAGHRQVSSSALSHHASLDKLIAMMNDGCEPSRRVT